MVISHNSNDQSTKNVEVKILIGIPASGKSTWAINFIEQNHDYVRLNRDSYRLMLKNQQVCSPKIEKIITQMLLADADIAIQNNLNIIIDNTNLKTSYINQFIEHFKPNADISFEVFHINIEEATQRDKKRENPVGESVITKMMSDYTILMESFDFKPIHKITK
jgi:predicted kinase